MTGAFALLLMTAVAAAQEPVTVTADTMVYEKETASYQADGDVKIEKGELTLFADRAILYDTKDLAEAEGNVRVLKEEDYLSGDHFTLDLKDNTGAMKNGRLFHKKANFHLLAEEIEKTGDATYHVRRGVMTTCDGDSPSWYFTAADLDVTLEGYAEGKHALFYVKGVPIFYTPYVVFPIKKERQSGFLTPSAGSTSKKGFTLTVPYYWAISDSQDATANVEYHSRRGLGTGLEYRYIRKRDSEGDFHGYLIYDTLLERYRGSIAEKHTEIFSPTVNLKSDINMVFDQDFLRDYGEETGVYNRQILDSRVSLTKLWHRFSLVGEAQYIQNLDAPNNRATLQRLPAITFNAIRQKLPGLPLYVTMPAEFVNFEREEGIRGQRLDLHPTLSYYANPGGMLELAPFVGYRQRFYNAYGADAGDGYHGSGIPDFGVRALTNVSRVYPVSYGSLQKVKHTVIPEAAYSYVPDVDQSTLPFFDFNDRIVPQNIVNYSIANYFFGKIVGEDGMPSYRELAYLKVSQGYDIRESRRELLSLVDERRPFTDIRVEARVSPVKDVSASVDSRFNVYAGDFTSANLNIDIKDQRGVTLGAGYRYSRDEVEYFESRLGISLLKPFVFDYTSRYSFDRGDFLESVYKLEYRQQCWSVLLTYRDRLDNKTGDKNREVLVNFNLYGMGPLNTIRLL